MFSHYCGNNGGGVFPVGKAEGGLMPKELATMKPIKKALISSGVMLTTAVLAIVIIQLVKAVTGFVLQNAIG